MEAVAESSLGSSRLLPPFPILVRHSRPLPLFGRLAEARGSGRRLLSHGRRPVVDSSRDGPRQPNPYRRSRGAGRDQDSAAALGASSTRSLITTVPDHRRQHGPSTGRAFADVERQRQARGPPPLRPRAADRRGLGSNSPLRPLRFCSTRASTSPSSLPASAANRSTPCSRLFASYSTMRSELDPCGSRRPSDPRT